MTHKRPQTVKKLDRHFILRAAINSTTALQMAMQVWNDPAQMDGEICDYVELINSMSIKLKNLCQYRNSCAHEDYEKQEIRDKNIVESKERNHG